jgi:hypothetical protein
LRTILFSLALLLSTFPLFADSGCSIATLNVDPPHAFQGEQIDVRVTGGCASGGRPPEPVVRFEGNTIILDFSLSSSGPLVPVAWNERVRLGTLNPGAYTIVARNDGVEEKRVTVVVEPRPFRVEPMSGAPGSRVIITSAPLPICRDTDPCVQRVLFGGAPAEIVGHTPYGELIVVVPPLGAGDVDVTLITPGRPTLTIPNGFRYTPAGRLRDYTRVMFPLTYSGGGMHGAQWHSEVVIRNESPVRLRTMPEITEVAAKESVAFPPVPRDGGAFFYIARGLESRVSFSSHIFDRSLLAETLGTEVPVVRAEDTSFELFIPNVPLDATRYRVMLRIYDFDGGAPAVSIIGSRPAPADPIMAGGSLRRGSELVPGFVAVDLTAIPRWPKSGLIDLHIAGGRGDRLWAMVSVTNNETQQVTLYTPQR